MIVKYVSAMRFTELKSKGSHSDKYRVYTWHVDKAGKHFLVATDRNGIKWEVRQRPKKEELC